VAEGTNLDLLLDTDYLSTEDEKLLKAQQEKDKISIGKGIGLAIESEWIIPSVFKTLNQPELEPDYDYRIDDETLDDLTKDLDEEYWEEFANASSKANAYQIKERMLKSQEANRKLATLGVTGTALRVGAAILDPAALIADAVTFGAARPFIFARGISRTSKYIRSGMVGAGQAGLLTTPVVAADPTRDIDDIGYAMLMGGAITSGLTRFMAPRHPDLKKFDAKTQELGKSFERRTLEDKGYKITPKGEEYFGPHKPSVINRNTDETEIFLKNQENIKPTNKNVYSKAEKEIVTSLKRTKELSKQDNLLKKIDNFDVKSKPDYFLIASRAKEITKDFAGIPASKKEKFILQSELNKNIDAMQITDVAISKANRNVGAGKALYKLALEDSFKKNLALASDNSVSQSALRVYKSLEKEGFEIAYNKNIKTVKDDVSLDKERGSQIVSTDNMPVATIKNSQKNLDLLFKKSDDEILFDSFFDRLDVTPNVAFAKARLDKSSVLRRSDNPFMRSTSEKMLEESTGNVDNSRSILTADIHKHNILLTKKANFYKDYEPAFNKYMLEVKGAKFLNKYNVNDRLEFSDLVSRGTRGEDIDVPGVAEGVLATRKLFKGFLDDLKEEGVEGAAQVLDNPNYFPRQWSNGKIMEVQEKIGGYDNLINFLKNSLIKGSDDLADEDALKISEKLYKSVTTNRFGDGFSIDRILKTTNEDELRLLLTEQVDLNPDEINDLVSLLLKPKKTQTTAVARLRRRASFDESHEEIIDGVKVKFTDLLDNNTEGMVGSYLEQMSGHLALARVGVKSRKDYNKIINKVKEGYNIPEVAKKYSTKIGKTRQKFELDVLETVYKQVIGIPTEKNVTGGINTVLRYLRKYNYANVFNQVGFSQLPELGNVISQAGVRGMIKYIPEFKNILTRAKNGKVNNELLDELESVVSGTGSNRLIDSTINRTDDFAGMTTKVGKLEKVLDISNRITSDFSGFHAVDTLSRRLAAITSFDKLAMHAIGKSKVTDAVLKRYRNIGFSDDELQAVFKNIRENSTFIEGGLTGRKIRRLNVDQWKDQDLVNKMSLYMSRHLRRVVQENNYGEMIVLSTESGLAKSLMQFRNFVFTAYSKQLLHGLHMWDFTAFASATSSAFIASLVYIGQTHIQSLGKSEDEKQDFLDEKLSTEAISKAAFQRSTYSTLLPAIYDTGQAITGGEQQFNYRSSGLDVNLWTGNPTISLLTKVGKATSSVGKAIRSDEYDFSKQDAYKLKTIAPFQNMLGITNILQHMIDESDLPSKSK
jgi:hypothetical protein